MEKLGGEFIDDALGEYLNFLPAASFPDFAESREMLNFAGVERLLQALGAYGFLSAKKGKTGYAKYFAPAAAKQKVCAKMTPFFLRNRKGYAILYMLNYALREG